VLRAKQKDILTEESGSNRMVEKPQNKKLVILHFNKYYNVIKMRRVK
jgi:hypothetical protein